MDAERFMSMLGDCRVRCHFGGSLEFGVVAALDREGRLFTVAEGEVLSRVDPGAFAGLSDRNVYHNPGGDVLWPAPEGTCFGYEYSTGKWRVPPGITGAVYRVSRQGEGFFSIEAEVDLVNNRGEGLPCIFSRTVGIDPGRRAMRTAESITYIGCRAVSRDNFLLAPWSLSQFDSAEGAEVVFPHAEGAVRDLYGPSDSHRLVEDGLCRARTDSSLRYQIAMGDDVDWIEYRNPQRNLRVRRTAKRLPAGLEYIDIADAAPDAPPSEQGARFSVYSDDGGFMEIEAAGGCPRALEPGTDTSLEVETVFGKITD